MRGGARRLERPVAARMDLAGDDFHAALRMKACLGQLDLHVVAQAGNEAKQPVGRREFRHPSLVTIPRIHSFPARTCGAKPRPLVISNTQRRLPDARQNVDVCASWKGVVLQ